MCPPPHRNTSVTVNPAQRENCSISSGYRRTAGGGSGEVGESSAGGRGKSADTFRQEGGRWTSFRFALLLLGINRSSSFGTNRSSSFVWNKPLLLHERHWLVLSLSCVHLMAMMSPSDRTRAATCSSHRLSRGRRQPVCSCSRSRPTSTSFRLL